MDRFFAAAPSRPAVERLLDGLEPAVKSCDGGEAWRLKRGAAAVKIAAFIDRGGPVEFLLPAFPFNRPYYYQDR